MGLHLDRYDYAFECAGVSMHVGASAHATADTMDCQCVQLEDGTRDHNCYSLLALKSSFEVGAFDKLSNINDQLHFLGLLHQRSLDEA